MIAGNQWDIRYEWKAVLLLSLAFGLVGLDRFIILPLFPVMMHDLGLDYQDLGNISAALAIAWGVSAVLMGRLSDRIGRRGILIASVAMFSLLAGASGLATGIGGLLIIRAVMGISEGAFTPTSIAATAEASKPTRRGMNIGIQQAMFPILGLGIGPILATQLLLVVPSWRWVFVIVAIPGLVLALFMYKVLRDSPKPPASVETAKRDARWLAVFKYRNVVVNVLSMFCILTCLFVVSAMMPNYLTDYLKLDVQQMGFVMSAIGLGGFTGQLILPALSDHLGRKTVLLLSFVGTGIFLYLLIGTGAEPIKLFAFLFMTTFFNFSLTCLTVGPLTNEAVPAHLASTAIGVVVGIGEIFGGGIAPALAGFIAKNYGIQYTLYLAMGGIVLGFFVGLALRETAPSKTGALVDAKAAAKV
jgi:MFS family permease